LIDRISRENMLRIVREIPEQSKALRELARDERIWIVGAIYDVSTGEIGFMRHADQRLETATGAREPV
jgi:carbonic anhydrase